MPTLPFWDEMTGDLLPPDFDGSSAVEIIVRLVARDFRAGPIRTETLSGTHTSCSIAVSRCRGGQRLMMLLAHTGDVFAS